MCIRDRHISGSVESFADLMNRKAKSIGLHHTHFVTPNGLDGENEGGAHQTTAEDLAAIMKYCIWNSPKRDLFLEITETNEYQFSDLDGTSHYQCHNHNAFLQMMDGAISGKTGFTSKAGYCYVGALKRENRCYIVALLGCGWPNHKNYKWEDTRKLMEYGPVSYTHLDVYKRQLKDSGVAVCTVVGFPLGAMSTKGKAAETEIAVKDGATEIDMVIHVGMIKSKDWDYVSEDIKAVVAAAGEGAVSYTHLDVYKRQA